MIPYGRQDITEEDIRAVCEVLRSDWLTQGPIVPRFEEAVADVCGARHAVAVNSATSALHVACLALGLGHGDWLWTTPITFVASANCGLYCGAQVDFVDIDPRTYNMCPRALETKLFEAEKTGRLPKVLVVVHLCGQPCEMTAIRALSQKYRFKVIEDASHAIGGKFESEYIGNCRYSDITVFSFHPVKIITSAEGGMALTQCDELAHKMGLFRSHGITRDSQQMTQTSDGPWFYQQIELGYNYRMTDLQAALGLSQLGRLDRYVARRRDLARQYDGLLPDLPVTLQWQHPAGFSAYHLYVIRLDEKLEKWHRQIFENLLDRGVGVNLHYIPVYRHPHYEKMGFYNPEDYSKAERYYRQAVTLPLYPALSEEQVAQVVEHVRLAIKEVAG
jgi:UDP-4-amino-4,6-dideoxy-N-acetyl-beta-L-altrosamine transaminase